MSDEAVVQSLQNIEEIVQEHRREFNEFKQNWREHQNQAKDAMRRVTRVDETMIGYAPSLKHLEVLPAINDNIQGLRSSIIKNVVYLIFGTMLLMAMVICILLIKDSIKDLKVGDWFELTTPKEQAKP